MNTRTQGFRNIVRTCSDLCRSIFVEIEQWWCKFDNFCAMEWIVERNPRTNRKETRTRWNVAHQWKRIEERHSLSDFERVIDSIRALKHVQKERKKTQQTPILFICTKTNWTIQSIKCDEANFSGDWPSEKEEGRGRDRNYFLNTSITSTTPVQLLRKCLVCTTSGFSLDGLSCIMPSNICLGEDIQVTFTTASWSNQTNHWSLNATPSKTF